MRQIAADPQIGGDTMERWRCELGDVPAQALVGHGCSRDGELGQLLWELALVTKERD